jgi:Ser/Thr protein kinase RdoA (MazF antagonist)
MEKPPKRYGLDTLNQDPYADRIAFPAQSSVLDEDALLYRVLKDYDIPEARTCRFLTRGDSDIYRVTTAGPRFYLKVFRPPCNITRTEAEARLVHNLAQRGVSTVRTVSKTRGGFACEVSAPEGVRPMLLFEEAPPPLPSSLDESLCERLGKAIAELHQAADLLAPDNVLSTLDCEAVFGEMVPYTRAFLSPEDYSYLQSLSLPIRRRLGELGRKSPDWGLCHADLVLSNLRAGTEGSIVFLDFGNAAHTWRAYELAGVHRSLSHRGGETDQGLWDTVLSSYARVRPIPQGIPELLPLFLVLRQIKFLAGNCRSLPLRRGTEPFEGDFLPNGMASVRRIAERIPSAI